MRRLPIDTGDLAFELPEGRYFMPSWWSEQDVEVVTDVLCDLLPQISLTLNIPSLALATSTSTRRRRQTSDLIVVFQDAGHPTSDLLSSLEAIPARYVFVRLKESRPEDDFSWTLTAKEHVFEALLEQLERVGHPLAPWNVRALELKIVSEFTFDVADFISLLLTTIEHRLRNSALGISSTAYRRSLMVAYGQGVAERLLRLTPEEIGPALELLLSKQRERSEDNQRARAGHASLRTVGLAGENIRSRPGLLIEQSPCWGALLHGLPREYWTPLAIRYLKGYGRDSTKEEGEEELSEKSNSEGRIEEMASRLRRRVAMTLKDIESGIAAVELIIDLELLAHQSMGLTRDILQKRDVLVERLRTLEAEIEPDGAIVSRILRYSLLFLSAFVEGKAEETECLQKLEALISEAQVSGVVADLIGALRLIQAKFIIDTLDDKEQLDEAERLLRRERNRPAAPLEFRATSEGLLGKIMMLRGDDDEAERWFRTALANTRKLADRVQIAGLCHQLGGLCLEGREGEKARELFLEAVELDEELEDRPQLAEACLAVGKSASLMGDFGGAIDWFERAKGVFTFLSDDAGCARSLRQLGLVYEKMRSFDLARNHYLEALEVDDTQDGVSSRAASQHHLGNLAYLEGDLDGAAEWYQQALSNFEQMSDTMGAASSHHQMGMVAQRRGDTEAAERHYGEALTTFKELDSRMGMAATYHQLGMVARTQKHYDQALTLFQRSLEYKKESEDSAGIASSLSQIGVLHTECKRPAEGLRWNLRSLALRQELGMTDLRHDLHWISKQREIVGEQRFELLLEQFLPDRKRIKEIHELLADVALSSSSELSERPSAIPTPLTKDGEQSV